MSDQPTNSRRIPILYIHSSDELYGSDRVILQLVSGLDSIRFEPIVVLPSDIPYEGKLSKALDGLNIKHYSIKMGVLRRRYFSPFGMMTYLYNLFDGLRRLSHLITSHNIRIIHSNTSAILGGAIIAQIHGIKHVWHIHEIIEKPKWLGMLIYPLIRAFSNKIITVSQAVAEPIANTKHQSKIHVVWNGIDIKKFSTTGDGAYWREQWGVSDNTIVTGVIGRISHWKGQELFLKAASLVTNECENIFFILAGDPPVGDESRLTNLNGLAHDLRIAEKVRFIPYTENVQQILSALDILVLPSTLPEPFGLVILEAMASARCVIAAAHGGPVEIIDHKNTGLLVPPNNVEALSAAIVELANDPERRCKMGQNGRIRAEKLFSIDLFKTKINQIYNDILEDNDFS